MVALVAMIGSAGCSASGDSAETTTTSTTTTTVSPATTTTTSPLPEPAMFGDLPSPCGPAGVSGVPTIAEGQNGTTAISLGVANDHGFPGADQPTVEMLDTARAFAAWCNDQGGIRGLPIEIVDLDAAVTGVPLAMERACAETFALVGGGWVSDDQMFPRFHECGLVSIPAYTTSAAATMANGKVQPIPTPIDRDSSTWLKWIADTNPSAVGKIAILTADVTTTRALADRLVAEMKLVGRFGEPALISFDPSGAADWTAIVRQLVDRKITAVSFIGDPAHLVAFATAMAASNYAPAVVFGEANLMSPVVAAAAGSLANLRIRTIHVPLNESDTSPAMASFLEMMNEFAANGRVAGLGLNTASAMLLFATAANACLDSNGNVLERECVLARAKEITTWTAGGLHADTDPAGNSPATCTIVVGIDNGRWSRVFPLLGSSDDNAQGWFCDDESIVSVEGDFGDPSIGVDPSRLN